MKKLNITLRVIAFILIQALLFSSPAFAAGIEKDFNFPRQTLNPELVFERRDFQRAFSELGLTERFSVGLLSPSEIHEYGSRVNDKTLNFKIGRNNFRIPPYLANRIIRVHLTGYSQDGIGFQRLGVGKGRRQPTAAVVLVDAHNFTHQLCVRGDDQFAILSVPGQKIVDEKIPLGVNLKLGGLQRQDSFLERSRLGIDFIDKVLAIQSSKEFRDRDVRNGLFRISEENPELRRNLSVNLAFFSKDFMLIFPRELITHSSVEVLRDREQRGRFIVICDRINPDNYVVFERRGEQVFILGEKERLVIESISRRERVKTFYFTDFDEGAEFCRNVSRELVTYLPEDQAGSFSVRKGVSLHFGADNRDVKVLKVNQVTQPTVTGYQIKQRAPEQTDPDFAAFPIYVLNPGFPEKITVDELEIDKDDSRLLFFDARGNKYLPKFLSFGGNYYQKADGFYSRDGEEFIVYRTIAGNNDIYTKIVFAEDGEFSIQGITWGDGSPVMFHDVKQISIPNIITQLSASRFVYVEPELRERFKITELKGTPYRAVYGFSGNAFVQTGTANIRSLSDFARIQRQVDKKIEKLRKTNLIITKTSLIFSLILFFFSATPLWATGEQSFINLSAMDFLQSFIVGAGMLGIVFAYKAITKFVRSRAGIHSQEFDPQKRALLQWDLKLLAAFLVLQSGTMGFISVFNDLRDLRKDVVLRPRMADNLLKLASVLNKTPDLVFSENKRAGLPLLEQYWELMLGLDTEEAKIAAGIYTQSYQEVMKLYCGQEFYGYELTSSQILRLVAGHILGEEPTVREPLPLKNQKSPEFRIVFDSREREIGAAGVAAAAITPVWPISRSGAISKRPKNTEEQTKKKRPEQVVTSGNEILMDTVELSSEGRRLSRNFYLQGILLESI